MILYHFLPHAMFQEQGDLPGQEEHEELLSQEQLSQEVAVAAKPADQVDKTGKQPLTEAQISALRAAASQGDKNSQSELIKLGKANSTSNRADYMSFIRMAANPKRWEPSLTPHYNKDCT